MLFVPERRRSSRLQSAIRAAAMFAPPICRRNRRRRETGEDLPETVISSASTKTAAPQRTSQRAERAIGRRAQRAEQSKLNTEHLISSYGERLAALTAERGALCVGID